MQTCPGFFSKSLLESPGNLLEICSVKFVDTLIMYCTILYYVLYCVLCTVQPIPYWLYKLHGLNISFTCEICGNHTYRGPKVFQRHFAVCLFLVLGFDSLRLNAHSYSHCCGSLIYNLHCHFLS